jgi:sialate O-acetylesterase
LKTRLEDADRALREYSPEEAQREYEEQLAAWQKAAAEAKARGEEFRARRPRLWNPYKSAHQPASLYNGMIAPIVPFGMRGAIWYQGESNASRAYQYRTLFPAMVLDWRGKWGQGDFPFLFVQLANFLPVQTEPVQHDATWPFLREAQTRALLLAKTAMASAIDIGEAGSIHPRNKQDVGRRLALAARAVAYGEQIDYSGPIYRSMRVKDGRAVVQFRHVGGGLTARGGGALKGFAVAGADRAWVWANAAIDGETVVVSSEDVAQPVAVRYNWANNPIGNLYNEAGLPASPFRTDDWEGDYGPTE